MKEKRFSSNKIKQKQLETKHLQEQTKKMEDKLSQLKRQIEEQKKMRSQMNFDSTVTRWQKATTRTTNGPLKSYAKQILEQQKQAFNQFGINQKKIFGTKTFQGALKQIKVEKEVQQDKNPTKIATFLKQGEEEAVPKVLLENNFFKAKMDVKSLIKQKTLEQFLQENYILEYLPRFREEDINELQDLRYVTRERLNELGVKAGHQVKIIKKIKEEFDKLLNSKEQPPKPSITTSEKVQSGYGEGNVNHYDDVESPRHISDIPIQSQIKQPAHNEQVEEEQESEEEQDVVLITAPMQSIELQVDEFERTNCYQCYKLVVGLVEWQYEEKQFCSQNCLQKFLGQLKKKCPGCGSTFLKTEGFREEGLWFCSLGCCPNQEQIQEMFLEWHRLGQ